MSKTVKVTFLSFFAVLLFFKSGICQITSISDLLDLQSANANLITSTAAVIDTENINGNGEKEKYSINYSCLIDGDAGKTVYLDVSGKFPVKFLIKVKGQLYAMNGSAPTNLNKAEFTASLYMLAPFWALGYDGLADVISANGITVQAGTKSLENDNLKVELDNSTEKDGFITVSLEIKNYQPPQGSDNMKVNEQDLAVRYIIAIDPASGLMLKMDAMNKDGKDLGHIEAVTKDTVTVTAMDGTTKTLPYVKEFAQQVEYAQGKTDVLSSTISGLKVNTPIKLQ